MCVCENQVFSKCFRKIYPIRKKNFYIIKKNYFVQKKTITHSTKFGIHQKLLIKAFFYAELLFSISINTTIFYSSMSSI